MGKHRLGMISGTCVIWMSLAAGAAMQGQQDGRIGNWASVVARNRPSTVLLRVEASGAVSFGSGVLLTDNGLLVTAAHILPPRPQRLAGDVLISSLIGWDSPSLDFSVAVPVDIQHVSEELDLAILKLRQVPATARPAYVADVPASGEPLLVMGYPNGGALRSTAGIASGAAANSRFTTDAAVGVGNSGGPVFNARAGLVGVILEGSRRNADGQIQLGFFVGSEGILKYLAVVKAADGVSRVDMGQAREGPAAIRIAYGVSEMKDDHPVVLAAHSHDYERRFVAQEGYEIVSARFESDSANHVTRGPSFAIESGGRSVLMTFTIESGPSIDRWRGWLSGNAIIEQQRLKGAR
jgi:S1-C subfamily serine protease